MDGKLISLDMIKQLPAETVGHDVLRYLSMPQLLGQEKDTLLYFIGRQLARQIEIEKLEDIVYLFDTFRWGSLELIKDRKRSLSFYLMSDDVAARMLSAIEIDYRLESGFLAEAIEKITDRSCECSESVNQRLYRVELTVVFTDD